MTGKKHGGRFVTHPNGEKHALNSSWFAHASKRRRQASKAAKKARKKNR